MEILCKFFPTFQTWIGFFSDFFLQNHKTRKLRYLTFHVLHVCQVSGEQKKWPLHVGIFEPKFPKFHQISLIFNLKSEFFRIFQKKGPNFRKLRNLTYLELHVIQFWAKKKNLFGSFIIIHSFIARTGAVGLGRFRLVHSRWSTAGEKLFFSYFFFLYIFSFFYFFVFFCFFLLGLITARARLCGFKIKGLLRFYTGISS